MVFSPEVRQFSGSFYISRLSLGILGESSNTVTSGCPDKSEGSSGDSPVRTASWSFQAPNPSDFNATH